MTSTHDRIVGARTTQLDPTVRLYRIRSSAGRLIALVPAEHGFDAARTRLRSIPVLPHERHHDAARHLRTARASTALAVRTLLGR